MPNLSQSILSQKRSGIREIVDLSHDMKNVYHMEIGEPLFSTPDHIIEAGCNALRTGFTRYTPNAGFLTLSSKIADRLNADYDLSLEPQNIIVTVGGIQAIASALRIFTEAGDEVLVPDPGWPNYESIAISTRVNIVRYKLKEADNYYPNLMEMQKLITSKTKVLIINTPSNPLGIVIPGNVMKDIVEFAERNNLFIISDEVYEKIIFDGKHACALQYGSSERLISVFTFSKTYAMTGWRIGYAASSKEIISQMVKMQESYISCAPAMSQKAAETALSGPQDIIGIMVKTYKENMEIASEILDRYGVGYLKPKGSFYMWVKAECEDSSAFAKEVLIDKNVAVAPGDTFGPSGLSFVRLSLASPKETIEKGVTALAEYIIEKRRGSK